MTDCFGGTKFQSLTMKLAVLLSCLYIYVVWGEEGKIRCSFMAVEQFNDAILECQFPENLNVSKKDFTIYHYTSDKRLESVVDCWWIKGILDCFIKPGFEYNRAVNTQLAITIRNVTASHIGNYTCQAAGYGSNFIKFCNLQLSEGMNHTCADIKEDSQSNASLTCNFREHIGKTQDDSTVVKENGHNKEKVPVMSCNIRYGATYQLECIFPEPYDLTSALDVFYNPDGGTERLVVACVKARKDEVGCFMERGFVYNPLTPNHVEFRLPDDFTKQSGRFKCAAPGIRTQSCHWSPTDGTFAMSVAINVFVMIQSILVIIIFLTIKFRLRKIIHSNHKTHEKLARSDLLLIKSVRVPCLSPPRLCQEVTWTGEYYTAEINLSASQSFLVESESQRVFLAGPPGTGKTMVLLLKGIQWLRAGHDVHVVSTGWWSLTACRRLYHLLLQSRKKLQEDGTVIGSVHFLSYMLNDETSDVVEEAVKDLSQKGKDGYLYVILDEARPEKYSTFTNFFNNLLEAVPHLSMWASSYYIQDPPAACQVEYLTTPYRSPPSVLKEVTREKVKEVRRYSQPALFSHSDLPVKHILHGGEGHCDGPVEMCEACGLQTAMFLQSLRNCAPAGKVRTTPTSVIYIGDSMTQQPIQWRDILILHSSRIVKESVFVRGLKTCDIPVKLLNELDGYEDVATARTDVVWMVNGHRVRGVERRVVVCLMGKNPKNIRLCHMARCSSQLVIVDYNSGSKDSRLKILKPFPLRFQTL